jgi:hypothetical protein
MRMLLHPSPLGGRALPLIDELNAINDMPQSGTIAPSVPRYPSIKCPAFLTPQFVSSPTSNEPAISPEPARVARSCGWDSRAGSKPEM